MGPRALRRLRARWALGLLAIMLAGCAALPPTYSHRDGVRPGTVVALGRDAEILARRAETCPPADPQAAYALIRYTGHDHLRWHAFPIPPGLSLEVGERVWLDINACRLTKME